MRRLDFRIEGLTEERLRRDRRRPGGGLAAAALGFLAATLLLRGGPGGGGTNGDTTPTVVEISGLTASASPTAVSPSTTPTPAPPTPTETAPAPTENPTPTPSGDLAFAPARADFGVRPVRGAPVSQTLRFENRGAAALRVSRVSVSGSAAGDFTARSGDCTGRALEAGGTCAVEVSFVPRAAGNRSAFLVVTDDTAGSPHRVRLSGTGAAPSAALEPSTLNFGEQLVGTSSSVRPVVLRNTGATAIKPGIRLQGDGDDQYTLIPEDCARAVPSGGRCRVGVRFHPSRGGRHEVDLTVADEAGTRLAGIRITGEAPNAVPIVRLDPPSLDFTSAGTQTVSVRNVGTSSLTITRLGLEGQDPKAFRIEGGGCLQSPVPPNGSCSIAIRYAPPFLSNANRAAELVIVDNAANSPRRIALRRTRLTPVPTTPIVLFRPIPPLEGLTVEQARQRLDQEGFRLGRVRRQAADAPPETIFRQDPQAGEERFIGTRVDVWVSGIPDQPIE